MTHKADYLRLESHLVSSRHRGSDSSLTVRYDIVDQTWIWLGGGGVWTFFSAIVTVESPLQMFLIMILLSLSVWKDNSNNTAAILSLQRRSAVLMLPFQIIDRPHIKGTHTLSLWSKRWTNKHTNKAANRWHRSSNRRSSLIKFGKEIETLCCTSGIESTCLMLTLDLSFLTPIFFFLSLCETKPQAHAIQI